MPDIATIFAVAGGFGYLATGAGVLAVVMVVLHLVVSMPWSRLLSLVLVVTPLAVGAAGWVTYRGYVDTALEYITEDTVDASSRYTRGPGDADEMRRELAEKGYAEARYPFYIGGFFFVIGAVLWVLAEVRYRGKRESQPPGSTG